LFAAAKLVVVQDGCDKVVKDPRPDARAGQRFFKGHDERVTTVTIAWGDAVPVERRGLLAASGQAAAKMGGTDATVETSSQGERHGHREHTNAGKPHGGRGHEHEHASTASHGKHSDAPPAPRRQRWPYVCVWDSRSLRLKARVGLYHPAFDGDITSLSFSGDGQVLGRSCRNVLALTRRIFP